MPTYSRFWGTMFQLRVWCGLAHLCGAAGESFAASSDQPWSRDQAILDTATQDLKTAGGIRGIEKDVPDLEKALAEAVPNGTVVATNDDHAVILADGLAQTLMAAAIAAKAGKNADVVADPYPVISLYLGSYYNEIGKPEYALRVLNAGIAASDANDIGLGEHDPELISEKGAAFESLKKNDDALATYTAGLKLMSNSDLDKARMFRGVGYSLTELGRLDDAESAYRKSLLCEPGNAHAENELQYIAQLRTGKAPTAAILQMALPKSDTPADKNSCPKE